MRGIGGTRDDPLTTTETKWPLQDAGGIDFVNPFLGFWGDLSAASPKLETALPVLGVLVLLLNLTMVLAPKVVPSMKQVPGKVFLWSMVAGGAIAYPPIVLTTLIGIGQTLANLALLAFKGLIGLFA